MVWVVVFFGGSWPWHNGRSYRGSFGGIGTDGAKIRHVEPGTNSTGPHCWRANFGAQNVALDRSLAHLVRDFITAALSFSGGGHDC